MARNPPPHVGGYHFSNTLLMRLRRLRHFPKNRQHQHTADKSKWRHEVKIVAQTLVEEFAQIVARQAAAKILERIDDSQRKSGHASAANIHWRG